MSAIRRFVIIMASSFPFRFPVSNTTGDRKAELLRDETTLQVTTNWQPHSCDSVSRPAQFCVGAVAFGMTNRDRLCLA